jgi:transcriptional regulator with XRE-family HTH domain
MSALSLRIRKARTLAAITQTELARRVGVKRSAVTQWEQPAGTTPSVEHMIMIAVETGMSFEWIATGRGPNRCGVDMEAAVMTDDFAMDAHESKALGHLRSLTIAKKKIAVQILAVLSQ